jgi:hypothetical protein
MVLALVSRKGLRLGPGFEDVWGNVPLGEPLA